MSENPFSEDVARLRKLVEAKHLCDRASFDVDYDATQDGWRTIRYRCNGCGEWLQSRTVTPCCVCRKDRDEKRDDPREYGCFRCRMRILRWLRELEEYLPTLSLLKQPSGITEYSAPVFGSRSPANDSALLHTDWRSESSNREGELTGELGALGVLASWSRAVREELELEGPKRATLATEVGCLRSNHDWICHQPWLDEYAAELRGVHAAVRAIARDPIPRSVGYCIRFKNNVECKGDVFELDDASGVKCSRCSVIYSGLDLERFRVAQEAG